MRRCLPCGSSVTLQTSSLVSFCGLVLGCPPGLSGPLRCPPDQSLPDTPTPSRAPGRPPPAFPPSAADRGSGAAGPVVLHRALGQLVLVCPCSAEEPSPFCTPPRGPLARPRGAAGSGARWRVSVGCCEGSRRRHHPAFAGRELPKGGRRHGRSPWVQAGPHWWWPRALVGYLRLRATRELVPAAESSLGGLVLWRPVHGVSVGVSPADGPGLCPRQSGSHWSDGRHPALCPGSWFGGAEDGGPPSCPRSLSEGGDHWWPPREPRHSRQEPGDLHGDPWGTAVQTPRGLGGHAAREPAQTRREREDHAAHQPESLVASGERRGRRSGRSPSLVPRPEREPGFCGPGHAPRTARGRACASARSRRRRVRGVCEASEERPVCSYLPDSGRNSAV